MADATRPTPRAHARTPLSPGSTHNSQRGQFHRWPNMPPSCFSELLNSYRRPCDDFSRSRSRVDGAVLSLAGGLLAWVRPEERSLATTRACSSLMGWMHTIVIATAAAEQYIAMESCGAFIGCYKLEGLAQLCSSFQQLHPSPCLPGIGHTSSSRPHRPWFLSWILVYERLPEGHAWRRPGWPNRGGAAC